MRVEKLDEDLYLFRGEAYDSGSLAVLDGERALLVDGLAAVEDARELRRTLIDDWGKTVALCISTHFFRSNDLIGLCIFQESILVNTG